MRVTTNAAPLLAQLGKVRDRAIKAGASKMEEKLSGEGTGVHSPGQPRRSSKPGEWPSRQSGETAEGIVSAPTGPLSGRVSAVGGAALDLHMRPEADGGRPFVIYALHDSEYLSAIGEAVRRG